MALDVVTFFAPKLYEIHMNAFITVKVGRGSACDGGKLEISER